MYFSLQNINSLLIWFLSWPFAAHFTPIHCKPSSRNESSNVASQYMQEITSPCAFKKFAQLPVYSAQAKRAQSRRQFAAGSDYPRVDKFLCRPRYVETEAAISCSAK